MALIKYADISGEKFTNDDWDHNVDEIDTRLTEGQQQASDAVAKKWPASNQAAMLALSNAKPGHFAFRADNGQIYLLTSADYATLSNWVFFGYHAIGIGNVTGLSSALSDAAAKKWSASNEAAMLALSDAKTGHFAFRADNGQIYLLSAADYTQASNWLFFGYHTITHNSISGTLPQSKITNLPGDLTTINSAITALQNSTSGAIIQGRVQFTIEDFTTAGTSHDEVLYLLPAHAVIHAVKVYTKDAFTSITNTYMRTRVFIGGTDIVTVGNSAPADTMRYAHGFVPGDHIGGQELKIQFTADVDIQDYAAGTVIIWYYYSINQLPS